ncbi:chaperone modulator CbpM [Planosporangium sp. 12N6]|uniref:chaperone modulator CbpM n=1 Tax=Planosporangium spinosum TaxID=3402278 RepID=UPI003CEC8DBA
MAYTLTRSTRQARLTLDAFAADADIHPELLRRLVSLGLIEPYVDAAGQFWFSPTQLSTLARARRLHDGLGLNYAALGVVLDLLARIDELEAALRSGRRPAPRSPSWT